MKINLNIEINQTHGLTADFCLGENNEKTNTTIHTYNFTNPCSM